MALAHFSIIVAIDGGNGIAKNGNIPWNSKEDMKFFRDTTVGKGKNAVIMGRTTYESIPEEHRPLKSRRCAVISRTWKQEEHPEIAIYSSLVDALAGLGTSTTNFDDVFVIGGEQIYKEAVRDFLYLCKKIHVTRFKTDYGCDQFFPYDSVKELLLAADPSKNRDYVRYTYIPKISHDEYQYLDAMKNIVNEGEVKPDRTGVGTKSVFGGTQMKFDLRDRLPIITTKKVFFESIIKELLFFVSGATDTKILDKQGVKIWNPNTKKAILEERKLSWNEGDMGPSYGHQWRHWGAEYTGCEANYTGKGIDQLQQIIDTIKTDPYSRRMIISAWNPSQLSEMALPPCHILAQFNVSGDRKWLDCQVYQRSGDMFLGIPFNIASYAMLTYMIAHITGLRPRNLTLTVGDAHIYNSHGDQTRKQLSRHPRPFPRLSFRDSTRLHELKDFTHNSFVIEGYSSWAAITADMVV